MLRVLCILLSILSVPAYANNVIQFKGVVLGTEIDNSSANAANFDVATIYYARAGYVINRDTPVPSCLTKEPSRIFARARAESMGIIAKVMALETSATGKKGTLFPPIFTARVECGKEIPIVITSIELDVRDKEDILGDFDRVPVF